VHTVFLIRDFSKLFLSPLLSHFLLMSPDSSADRDHSERPLHS